MGALIVGAFVAGALLCWMAAGRRAGLRVVGRLLLAGLTLLWASITGWCLYGAFAWETKGGGVLLLVAVPFALLTMVFGTFLFTGPKQESYYDLPVAAKILDNEPELQNLATHLDETIARKMKERFGADEPE